MCIDEARPTFRFFGKAMQGAAASLRAEALVERPSQYAALGSCPARRRGGPPSPPAPPACCSTARAPWPSACASRRLGDWQIDDLFVDPRKMG